MAEGMDSTDVIKADPLAERPVEEMVVDLVNIRMFEGSNAESMAAAAGFELYKNSRNLATDMQSAASLANRIMFKGSGETAIVETRGGKWRVWITKNALVAEWFIPGTGKA